jgi:16S rRNA (adenine1518-N6/adenine1519-N6)-dimethyltransferase
MNRNFKTIHQKKSLGQVFLNQQWPVQRVIDKLESLRVTRVLEIGPGGGALTKQLVLNGFKVTALEKDHRFVEFLNDWAHKEQQNLEIIQGDCLKFDLAEWLLNSKESTAIVGNIPYNISSPILLWALPHIRQIKGMMFLVQLEFAQRLVARTSTSDYGSLTVYTHLRAKIHLEAKVDRKCFTPVPRVDSALVSLSAAPIEYPQELLQKVETVTRTSFMQRRKMLRNGVRQWIQHIEDRESPIDLNRRPETLTPEEFIELTNFIYPPKP